MENMYKLSLDGNNGCPKPMASSKSMTSLALDAAIQHEIRMGTLDPNMDKKQMRRIISNRYAAKKCHYKMANKKVELENKQKDLEEFIATLGPRLEHEQQLLSHLKLDNEMLYKRLQIRTEIHILKEAQIRELTMERDVLRALHGMHQQPPQN